MYFYWFIIMIFTLFQASAWVNMPSLPRMEDASLATTVREDLPDIQKRDTLRVITQHSASSYFLFRGDERGLEYELARQFADMLDVHLQMVIPPTPEDMIPWLMEGKGDIIAPGLLTAVPNHPVALRCLPYDSSYFVVVTRGSAAVASLDELAGRTVHAIPSGPGYYALIDLNTQLGGAVTIAPAPSGWDYEMLLAALSKGEVEAVIAPWPLAKIERSYHQNITIGPRIGQNEPVGWYVRPNANQLRDAVDVFMSRVQSSGITATLRAKYFDKGERAARYRAASARFLREGQISPYDHTIKLAAEEAGLDWLLVAAVAYEESGFAHDMESPMGAVGLMQIMPETAASLGVADVLDPVQNIHAGTRYLRDQIAQFGSLEKRDAIAFGLAAYNVGLGHVEDARKLAAEIGRDPNRWRGNVEAAMELLAHQRFYRRASSGYFRGSETARYVNAVLARWETYERMMRRVGSQPAV